MKIPDHLAEVTLKDTVQNETVYTVPWAMYAETDGELFINGKYDVSHSPGGTNTMILTRVDDGFRVDISRCKDYRWSQTGCHHVGGSYPMPVLSLKE